MLVVVERIVLHADSHALLLHSLDITNAHAARQVGVFAHVLEATTIERCAADVDTWAEEDRLVAIACLFADGLTIAQGKVGVPSGGKTGEGGEGSTRVVGAAGLLPLVPKHNGTDAVRAVGAPQLGDAETAYAGAGELGLCMDDGNLLVERHARQGVIDALLNGLAFVEIDGQGLGLEGSCPSWPHPLPTHQPAPYSARPQL